MASCYLMWSRFWKSLERSCTLAANGAKRHQRSYAGGTSCSEAIEDSLIAGSAIYTVTTTGEWAFWPTGSRKCFHPMFSKAPCAANLNQPKFPELPVLALDSTTPLCLALVCHSLDL